MSCLPGGVIRYGLREENVLISCPYLRSISMLFPIPDGVFEQELQHAAAYATQELWKRLGLLAC